MPFVAYYLGSYPNVVKESLQYLQTAYYLSNAA